MTVINFEPIVKTHSRNGIYFFTKDKTATAIKKMNYKRILQECD